MSQAHAVTWDEIPEDIVDPENEITHDSTVLNQCLLAGAKGVDIPNTLYHQLDGISGSGLSILAESNKHFDNRRLFNLGEAPALNFGSLFHCACLEPDSVEDRYTVEPKFDNRSLKGKVHKLEFMSENSHKIVMSKADMAKAKAMARNVHAVYGDVLDACIKECSWFVEVDGLILKSRPDCYDQVTGHDIDLKAISLGIKPFSNLTLEHHIKKFNYHLSAALRMIVRQELGQVVGNSYLLFCDTGPGNRVRLIQIAPEWLAEAETVVRDLLDGRRFYLMSKVDNPVTVIDDRNRQFGV